MNETTILVTSVLVMFLMGTVITSLTLKKIEQKERRDALLSRTANDYNGLIFIKKSGPMLILAGGVLAVLTLLFFMFLLPRDIAIKILALLAVLEFLGVIILMISQPLPSLNLKTDKIVKPDYTHPIWKQLVLCCGGNDKTALRLINLEKKNHPNANWDYLCDTALLNCIKDKR